MVKILLQRLLIDKILLLLLRSCIGTPEKAQCFRTFKEMISASSEHFSNNPTEVVTKSVFKSL